MSEYLLHLTKKAMKQKRTEMRRYIDMSIRAEAEGKGSKMKESLRVGSTVCVREKISKIHSSSLNSKLNSLLFIFLVKSNLCLNNEPNLCVFDI